MKKLKNYYLLKFNANFVNLKYLNLTCPNIRKLKNANHIND
jgi:hypothetical protein